MSKPRRISELKVELTPQESDLLAIVSENETKRISFGTLKENLPGSAADKANNTYLVPVNLTVSDGNDVYLTGSLYENTQMIKLNWSGGSGNMNLYLPDCTTTTNTNRAIRFICDSTFDTSTRSELTPLNGSSQTLDGSSSPYTINKAYEGIMVWSDGTEWFRIQTKA